MTKAVRWTAAREAGLGQAACRPVRAAAIWSPVDAVLASRKLSGLVVAALMLGVVSVCFRDGGVVELILNVQALAVIWSAAYSALRLGRKWRGTQSPPVGLARAATRWQRAGG